MNHDEYSAIDGYDEVQASSPQGGLLRERAAKASPLTAVQRVEFGRNSMPPSRESVKIAEKWAA